MELQVIVRLIESVCASSLQVLDLILKGNGDLANSLHSTLHQQQACMTCAASGPQQPANKGNTCAVHTKHTERRKMQSTRNPVCMVVKTQWALPESHKSPLGKLAYHVMQQGTFKSLAKLRHAKILMLVLMHVTPH